MRYWAPVRSDVPRAQEKLDQKELLAHFDDDKRGLAFRIARIRTGYAHVETPPSRTRHFVSNVVVLGVNSANEAAVASNFIVYRNRYKRTEAWFVGCREDRWRSTAGGWRAAERKIIFDHNIIEAITCFF